MSDYIPKHIGRTSQRQAEGRRYYYWITATDETGKPYLIFGHAEEEQARQRGLELLSGLDFQLVRLPTSNLSRASSFLKGNRLEETRSLRQASQRLGHDRSLRRLKRRNSQNTQRR